MPEPDSHSGPRPASWSSTTTLPELAHWLCAHTDILLVTHNKPDGDAIGSCVGVARALRRRARQTGTPVRAEVLLAGPVERWADSLLGEGETRAAQRGACAELEGWRPTAILIQDTGSRSQLEGVWAMLEGRAADAAIVDHHRSGDAEIASRRLINPEWAAVCEGSAALCTHILGLPSPRDLPAEIAEMLALGLGTDTGWFRHSNVRPETLRLAADLIEAGADQAKLFSLVEQCDREERFRLKARALSGMELLEDGRLAVMTLRTSDFHATRADPTETAGLADDALRLASVRVAVVINEVAGAEPALSKLSLRSKAGPGMVDVNAVARELDGGGHANAAGARVEGTPERAREAVIAAVRKHMP